MCNFRGYNNARSRRNERGRTKQEAYNRNKTLNMALKAALNPTKQSNQQIISKPKQGPPSFTQKERDAPRRASAIIQQN
ncbi:hypothetical protein [Arsenophonus endosymbiont of Aleurodicus floccissimus]|uniref:hypothetical protein n=1 Tax=Arsenophonus endosymbiont of Aleurodicus floccissimus TaxID=2152761 RepID=UPI000E6AF7E6|nr:hypothetical protein [Arsenophonus endosymbiont of Aleurodicus floccissimus]